jgi:hypothetical protein
MGVAAENVPASPLEPSSSSNDRRVLEDRRWSGVFVMYHLTKSVDVQYSVFNLMTTNPSRLAASMTFSSIWMDDM